MESKKKTFARKVIALFLAVIMSISCFSAAFTAFAANTHRDYNDSKLASNIMAWADVTDEQALEAALDYVDTILAGANINLDVEQNMVVAKLSIHAKLRSVNDIIELLGNQVPKNVDPLKGVAGDLKQLNLSQIQNIQGVQGTPGIESACGMDYRSTNSAKVLIKHFARFLNDNANSTNSIFYKLLDGTFTLGGIATSAMKGTVYEKLQPMLGTKAGYESDFFYNVTKAMMLSKTGWFTPEEVKGYEDGTLTWNIDTVTRNKVNEMWLNRISAWVTYTIYNHDAGAANKPHTESSAERLDKIQAEMKASNSDYATACTKLGYDPNLSYCTVDTMENNINIFAYGNESLKINEDTTLYSFAAQAFKLAWKTVLKDTLQLVHVNHDNWKQDGTPTNFDNDFFYFMRDNNKWNTNDWKANYTQANIEAWANDRYPNAKVKENGALRPMASAQEFIDAAKAEYTSLSRTMIENPTYTWKDLEIMQFFNKLRYSPLADVYFDVQTGPLNLYLTMTGTPNTNAFLDAYAADLTPNVNSTGILDKFNDGLVAMCKDLFVAGKNIGLTNPDGTVTPIALPAFVVTNDTANFVKNSADHNDAAKATLVDAITSNFFMLIEYLLQTSDVNVLANLYNSTGQAFDGSAASYQLTEKNLEASMLPLLIAAVNEVQINGQRLMDQIHDETWDKCKSVEEVAIHVLEEHLAWILPDKDYQGLYEYDAQGVMKATKAFNTPADNAADFDAQPNLLEDVILVMTRDAVGYQLAPILPLRHKAGNDFVAWSPYTSEVATDNTTLFDLLNAVIVFYCASNTWTDDGTNSQGMAEILGVVEKNGNSKITLKNNLFQNVDILVNHVLPFFGILQTGDMAKSGQFDSHEFLIEVLVEGALDIDKVKVKNNNGGIIDIAATKNYSGLKVFLYQLLTIMSCDPIMNMDIEHVLYDVVICPLVNNVFGARYDSTYPHLIPTSTEMNSIISNGGKTPIDTLFRKQVLVHYNGKNAEGGIGVLGILFDAVNKALGTDNYGDTDNKQGIEGTWEAIGFIIQSVANLDQWFAPQLKTHKFGVLESKVTNATVQGVDAGAALPKNTIEFKNLSNGLNRFYKDEVNGNKNGVAQQGRYYMHVKSISAVDNNTKEAVSFTYGKTDFIVAPQEIARIALDGTAGNKETTVYRFDATYDVIEKANPQDAGTVLFTDQIATTYHVVSTVRDWYTFTYRPEHKDMRDNFPGGISEGKFNTASTKKCGSNGGITVSVPKKVIVQMSQPEKVWDAWYRIQNTKNGFFDGAGSIRGLYFRPDDANLKASYVGDANASIGAEVNVISDYKGRGGNENELAIAAIDPTTGDILKTDMFDYFHPTENRWYRGGANGTSKHSEGNQYSDGAYIGYSQTEINNLAENIKSDPKFKIRTHVVWTLDEYLKSEDFNKQSDSNQETVKYVSRTQIGVDANAQPVYKYNFALIRISNALLYGDNGSISYGTPIPGIYMNIGQEEVGKGKSFYHTLARYDGKTELEPMMAGATLMASWEGKSSGQVHMDFEVVDDRNVKDIRNQYTAVTKEFAPYKATDFAKVDYNGTQVNPYEELQKALGAALKESAKIVTLTNTAEFKSNKIDIPVSSSTSSQVGAPAYKRASINDPITEELAVKIHKSTGVQGDFSTEYFYLDKACTIPVLTTKAITTADVEGIKSETIDGKSLQTGTTKIGGDKVVKIVKEDGSSVWHFMNAPKYEYAWDTTTYTAPYYGKTSKQVGTNDENPELSNLKYEAVSFKNANNKAGVWTNVIPETKSIIKPNEAKTDYRNSMEKAADTLRYWDQIADKNIAGGGGDRIMKEVRDAFAPYNNEYINYDVQSFNNVKEVVAEAMSLVKTTWEDDLSKPIIDPLTGQQVTDKLTGKPKYEQKAVYSTTASSLEVENAISEYNKAIGRLIKKDYTDNKLVESIAWSTNGATKDQITFTKGADTAGKTVYTEVKAPTAYYGTVENGVIVNKNAEGAQAYTDASWANYINCLGRAVDAAQTYSAPANNRAEGFYARNDLMLAENNLDPFVPTEPEGPTTITVSGKVYAATNLTGTTKSGEVKNVQIKDDQGNVLGVTGVDGSFSVTVPVGTTSLIVHADNATIDRTVTLAGDKDVTNAVIPVVICDYTGDGFVNVADLNKFVSSYEKPNNYNNYSDFNADGFVNVADLNTFTVFYDRTVSYDPLTIA